MAASSCNPSLPAGRSIAIGDCATHVASLPSATESVRESERDAQVLAAPLGSSNLANCLTAKWTHSMRTQSPNERRPQYSEDSQSATSRGRGRESVEGAEGLELWDLPMYITLYSNSYSETFLRYHDSLA